MLCLHLPPPLVQGWLRKFESSGQRKLLRWRFPVLVWCFNKTISHYADKYRSKSTRMRDVANRHSYTHSSGYGKVFLVRHKDTGGDKLYAMKMLLWHGLLVCWDCGIGYPASHISSHRREGIIGAGFCLSNPQGISRYILEGSAPAV